MIALSMLAPAGTATGMLLLAVLLWPRSDGPAVRDSQSIRALDSARARARRRESEILEHLSRRSQIEKAQAKARSAGLLVSGIAVLLAQAICAAMVGIATYSYTGNLPAGVVMALAGWQIPSLALEASAAPKKRAYAGQVEGLLLSLSTSLSASQEPLIAVLRRIAENTTHPLQTDLWHLIATTEEGKPIGTALEEWANRIGDRNLMALSGAVSLHDRYGGDLAGTVDYLAERVRKQASIRAKHKAESAGDRIALLLSSVIPTAIYMFFVPRMPALAIYLRTTGAGVFGVAFLASVQAGAIFLVRLYVMLPELLGS